MMSRTSFTRLAPFAVLLMLAGCASSDGTTSEPDDITPHEIAEGEAWAPGAAGDSHDTAGIDGADDDAALPELGTLSTPLEDSAPFLEKEDAVGESGAVAPPGAIDLEGLEQISACQRATGYTKGKATTICVTTIDGKLVEVNTARAYVRMRTAARAAGVTLRVVSGFRTMAQQRYLYDCYKTKRCNNGNLAAPPGYSNHQSGKALDLNTSARGVYSYLSAHGKKYGFRRTVPSEKWHWEH